MTSNQRPIVLVLGATGTIGSHIIKDLDGKDVHLRIASRKQDKVDELRQEGKDSVYLDLDKPETFALALAGVDRVFLLTGYSVAMLTQSKTLVDAAKKAGVSHIVHVGVFAEWDTTDAHFVWHQMIEKYIEASDCLDTSPSEYVHECLHRLLYPQKFHLHDLLGGLQSRLCCARGYCRRSRESTPRWTCTSRWSALLAERGKL